MLYKDQSYSTLDAIAWDDNRHIMAGKPSWEEAEVVWNRVRDEYTPGTAPAGENDFTLWGPEGEPSLYDLR